MHKTDSLTTRKLSQNAWQSSCTEPNSISEQGGTVHERQTEATVRAGDGDHRRVVGYRARHRPNGGEARDAFDSERAKRESSPARVPGDQASGRRGISGRG